MAHFFLKFTERGYISITHIRHYAKPALCFLMIFIILLSFAVGTAPQAKAIAGIDDLFMTLYSYMAGAAAAVGGASAGVTSGFSYSASQDSGFDISSDPNKTYALSERHVHHDTDYYLQAAVDNLPDRDNYYYDWVAVFDAIKYFNERPKADVAEMVSMQDEKWIWNLIDGKFTLAQMIEMGFVKRITMTDNNTYWVTNIGYTNTDFASVLEAQRERIRFLIGNGKVSSIRPALYSLLEEENPELFDYVMNSGSWPNPGFAIYRYRSGSLKGYIGFILGTVQQARDLLSWKGKEYRVYQGLGAQWIFNQSFDFYNSYKQDSFYVLGFSDPWASSFSLVQPDGLSLGEEIICMYGSDGSTYNANLQDGIPADEAATYIAYLDARIDELGQNPDETNSIVYAPPIYDKDGTLVQAPTYVYPVTDEMVTDKTLTAEGVVDNPASGSGTDDGILRWLQGLWDWLTGLFWDAITMQRKQRIVILCSSQVFTRVAKPIREQAFYVINCKTIAGRYTKLKWYNADLYLDYADNPSLENRRKLMFKAARKDCFVQSDYLRGCYNSYALVERLSREGFAPKLSAADVSTPVNITFRKR